MNNDTESMADPTSRRRVVPPPPIPHIPKPGAASGASDAPTAPTASTNEPLDGAVVPSYPEPVLRVRPMTDPVLATLGHDPRSVYVEQFWVSILGPTAVLFLRRVSIHFDARPEGFDMDPLEWALELGLGSRGGKHSPMWRTIDRICRFGLAQRNGANLSIERNLPPLTLRQVQRLPAHLQAAHAAWRSGHDQQAA